MHPSDNAFESVCVCVCNQNHGQPGINPGSLKCHPYMHEVEKALILLLPALDELQCKGLVAAEGAYCMLHLFLLFSAELEKKFKQGLTGQIPHWAGSETLSNAFQLFVKT